MDTPTPTLDIPFTEDELVAIIDILRYSKDAFTFLASKTAKKKDVEAHSKLTARARLSEILYVKMAAFAETGKPLDKSSLH